MNLKTILKIIDVKTLFASLLPVLFGSVYSLYAFGKMNPLLMVVMAFALMLVQAATNLFNDYKDYVRGTDSEDRADEKALVSGELTERQILGIMTLFTVTAIIIGVIIASMTSWVILLVTAFGLASAYLYSSGPKPISYTPFGEIAAGCIMGFGITTTVIFIQAGSFHWQSIPVAVPTVIFIAYIMFTNNFCDREKDKIAGRMTLPGMLPFETGRTVWLLFCFLLVLLTVIETGFGFFPASSLIVLLLMLNYRTIIGFRHYPQEKFRKERMMGLIGMLGIQYHLLMIAGLLSAYALQI